MANTTNMLGCLKGYGYVLAPAGAKPAVNGTPLGAAEQLGAAQFGERAVGIWILSMPSLILRRSGSNVIATLDGSGTFFEVPYVTGGQLSGVVLAPEASKADAILFLAMVSAVGITLAAPALAAADAAAGETEEATSGAEAGSGAEEGGGPEEGTTSTKTPTLPSSTLTLSTPSITPLVWSETVEGSRLNGAWDTFRDTFQHTIPDVRDQIDTLSRRPIGG